MRVEIIVRAAESAYSYGTLAEKTLVIESDDPAIFQIGPTAEAMLADVIAGAQAKIDAEEAEAPESDEE